MGTVQCTADNFGSSDKMIGMMRGKRRISGLAPGDGDQALMGSKRVFDARSHRNDTGEKSSSKGGAFFFFQCPATHSPRRHRGWVGCSRGGNRSRKKKYVSTVAREKYADGEDHRHLSSLAALGRGRRGVRGGNRCARRTSQGDQ